MRRPQRARGTNKATNTNRTVKEVHNTASEPRVHVANMHITLSTCSYSRLRIARNTRLERSRSFRSRGTHMDLHRPHPRQHSQSHYRPLTALHHRGYQLQSIRSARETPDPPPQCTYSNSRPTCGTVSPTQVISAAHARPKQRLTRCQSLKCETLCAANLTHAAIPAAKLGLRPRWLLRCPSHPTLHPQIQVHWLPLFLQRCQRQKGLVLSILTRRLQHLHAGERDRAGGHLPFPWLPRTAAR